MTTEDILEMGFRAEMVAKEAMLAHYMRRLSERDANYHVGCAHSEFAKLAKAMGYRIEKIEAAPSPAAAITDIRADLAEIDGRAA